MPTATIYGGRMICASSGSPSSTSQPGAVVTLQGYYSGSENRAYMAFDIPDSIKRKQILSGTFYVYARSDDQIPQGLSYTPIYGGYRDNINWNNKPSWYYNSTQLKEGKSYSWKQIRYRNFITENSYKTGALRDVLVDGVAFNFDNDGVGQIYTPYSSNRPYVVVEYADIPLRVSATPEAGFVDKHKEIALSVRLYAMNQDAIELPKLASVTIRWRDGEAGVWHELAQNAEQNRVLFTLPADSVTSSMLQWGIVRAVSNDNVATTGSSVYSLSTVDSLSTALPKEPINAMIDVEAQNVFRWQHVIATGSDPTGYELQYTLDGLTWQGFASRTGTAETSCTVPANTLPAGKLQWRVRTYNGDGVAGAWSEPAAIVGYGAPPAPIISEVTNSARPTIRWQSATQIAYELIIRQGGREILHVGETAGTDKAYTVTDFLPDGAYTVSVRIENSGLYWSQWAALDFTIQTVKPAAPTVTRGAIPNGVAVQADDTGDAMYLLRDGVPVAKLYGGQATDFAAVGPHAYAVRRVNADGAFADSAPLTLTTKIEQAVIAPADNPAKVIGPLLQAAENEYPSTASLSVEMMHYAGRRHPVAVTDGAISEEYSPVFAAGTAAQWRALRELMDSAAVVLYRNSAGDCAYCVITALNPTKSWNSYMTWETTLARVDYVERIDYEG